MPSLQHEFLKLHERLYVASDGRVGHKLIGVPSLLLRSTGAKTGQARTNALVYARDGDRYVVVASNGGAPKAPAWLHNVRAQPSVEVQVGRRRSAATAAEVTADDPDYARLWQLVNDKNRGRFAAYQERTTRRIPMVTLTV